MSAPRGPWTALLRCAVALLVACGARSPASCPLEPPPGAGGLPAEIQHRLALIRQAECRAPCAPRPVPETSGGLYTMEPRNTSSSDLPSACERRAVAATRIADDLWRIYAGCAACIDQCAADQRRGRDRCRVRCGLGSLADHDAHVAELTARFAADDGGFADWRRLGEPLPAPPVAPDQPLGCAE